MSLRSFVAKGGDGKSPKAVEFRAEVGTVESGREIPSGAQERDTRSHNISFATRRCEVPPCSLGNILQTDPIGEHLLSVVVPLSGVCDFEHARDRQSIQQVNLHPLMNDPLFAVIVVPATLIRREIVRWVGHHTAGMLRTRPSCQKSSLGAMRRLRNDRGRPTLDWPV